MMSKDKWWALGVAGLVLLATQWLPHPPARYASSSPSDSAAVSTLLKDVGEKYRYVADSGTGPSGDRTNSADGVGQAVVPSYSPPQTVGVPRYYAFDGGEADGDEADKEARAEEARQAKWEFEDAANELRGAVDELHYNRWSDQMPVIRDRLEDADETLSRLESLRPGDFAVQNARNEIDGMRDHMSRLHFENWRDVRPDLDSSASAIEDEAGLVSVGDD